MIEAQLREAFASFANTTLPAFAREREIVSGFVLTHLLPTLASGRDLSMPGQIGIEVAVPQRRDRPHKRRDPDVCKDVVLWPASGMTCWDGTGRAVHFPRAVLEWKSVNRKDPPAVARRKRQVEHPADVEWLRWFVRQAPGSEGYAVLVDLSVGSQSVRVHRVTAAAEAPEWFASSLLD